MEGESTLKHSLSLPYAAVVPYSERLCVCRQNQILVTLEPDRLDRLRVMVVLGQKGTRTTQIIEQHLQREGVGQPITCRYMSHDTQLTCPDAVPTARVSAFLYLRAVTAGTVSLCREVWSHYHTQELALTIPGTER